MTNRIPLVGLPSIVWAIRDGLSTDLPNNHLPWYNNIFLIYTLS